MHSLRHALSLVCIAVASCSAGVAHAQHAGFVLFGEPDPANVELPQHRRAVAPLTGPYYHEDSFVGSDLRAWFVYHDFPKSSPLDGGRAKVYALQARIALTESLQVVAYKDGYIEIESGAVDEEGWNDIAAGLKWAFLQDYARDFHAAVGIGYQIGAGDDEVLQDDDELRLWASVNKGFDRLHLGGTINLFIPTDGEDPLGDSESLSWHLHADYHLTDWFSPAVEINGYHALNEGDNTPLPFSGIDVANLGGGQSEDVITLGLGAELRPWQDLGLRAAYELPLTKGEDLFGYRWTLSAVLRF